MSQLRPLLAASLSGLAIALLTPSVAAADTRVVGANLDGRAIGVDRGDTLKVRLRENPSTGSSWSFAARPARAVLRYVEQHFVQDDAPEGTSGVPGKRTYVWRARGRGRTSLRLIQRAPGTGEVIERFTLSVRVR